MTKSETLAILTVLQTAYPQFYKNFDAKGLENAANLWFEMFKDEKALIVSTAVKAFIATDSKGFPPVIGVIKERIAEIKSPATLTEYEAWNIVYKAICGSDYMWDAEEEFAKLAPEFQRLVGSASMLCQYARMSSSDLNTVVASNFMRSYRAKIAHEKDFVMLPEEVKSLISQISEKLTLPSKPEMTEQEWNDRRNEIHKALE